MSLSPFQATLTPPRSKFTLATELGSGPKAMALTSGSRRLGAVPLLKVVTARVRTSSPALLKTRRRYWLATASTVTSWMKAVTLP